MAVQYSPGATVITGQAEVTSDTTAFEQLAYFQLRSHPMYDMCADVRTTAQSHNGAAVQFNIYDDIAETGPPTALTDGVDVTPDQMGDSTVTVTLAEYGKAVVTTRKLRGTSFLNVDADAANIIGFNMVDNIDRLVHEVIRQGTNFILANGATAKAAIVAGDTLQTADAREAVAGLRKNSALPWNGSLYKGFVHPDVSFDVRGEQAVTDVIQLQIRQDEGAVRAGAIGAFNGIDWYETPRIGIGADSASAVWTNAGAANVDVYPTFVMGRQSLAKAASRAPGFSDQPSLVHGPVTDTLRRFQPVGWYHLVGYSIFREAALYRIESASSIGTN